MEAGQAFGELAAMRAANPTGIDFRTASYTTLRANILSGGDAVAPVLPQTN